MPFQLDPRLKNDTFQIKETNSYLLLMMNERRYPWFIVVPKVADASEWHDLDDTQQTAIHLLCVRLGQAVQQAFEATKVNIAALGNVVSQLHIHVIGRNPDDAAWPNPVWGFAPPTQSMDLETKNQRVESLGRCFDLVSEK